MKQSIGEFLATLRKAHGYTQQEVADRLSVSNRTVSAWERGAALPDILLLPALAELYGVTADEILAGERRAAGETRPVLSEKSETRLLKKKLSKFGTQAIILFGVYFTGLLLFFIGLYLEFSTSVWVGWKWWLVLLFLGLVTAIVCAVCLLALWRGCENSADEEFAEYGGFCIRLRKKVAVFCYLAAAISLLSALIWFFLFLSAVHTAGEESFLISAIVCFLFALGKFLLGFFLVDAARRRYGGEEAKPIRARNAKRYRKCALYCLIPVTIGVGGIILFAYWQPETRIPLLEAGLEEFTAEMETLVCKTNGGGGSKTEEYSFGLSALSKTAVEGESYDLGNGFSCTFWQNMEICTVKSQYEIVSGFGAWKEHDFYRLYASGEKFSVYNVRYAGYNDGSIHAVDWKGDELPLEFRFKADKTRATLSQCYREDYFLLAAPISLLEILAGVGVCVLICARKREKTTEKL